MKQILLKLFSADPRTVCDEHLTREWSFEDIFRYVCSYGVLVYSRDALVRLYRKEGLDLSSLDLDKSVIQWTSSTYNPIQIESDGQDFKKFLLLWEKLSVSKRDELFAEYRRQIAHYLLGISVDKKLSSVEEKAVAGIVERMIFVPSGTDVPALMRLYFPGESMSILMTDEQGSGTMTSAADGIVPSFGKVSDNIPQVEANLVKYRDEKMIPLGDSMVARTGNGFNEMLNSDDPTLSMLALPPKTGICPAGLSEMLEEIAKLPVDDCDNIVLIDMAQCRSLTNKRLDQKLKQWLVTGRFDFLFTPSKFLGVPPFVGVCVLSEIRD